MRIHQLTHGMMFGDAISNHVLEIDARLRAWGYESHIFSSYIAPEMQKRIRPDRDYVPYLDSPDDVLIYHYSVYNPNARMFQLAQGRRLLIYHNITPAHFFYDWDATITMQCYLGREILGRIVDCDLALGVSEFNRQELIAAGAPVEKTGVLPIFLTTDLFESSPPDPTLAARLRDDEEVNWLTVGRVVPNKALEDVIRIFYVYNQAINPRSHLYIAGSQYVGTYVRDLKALVTDLGLEAQVSFTGRVSDAALVTYYRAADLYITASLHEGFCVPLIESMYFGVPILARRAAAIPETLGEAGILFPRTLSPEESRPRGRGLGAVEGGRLTERSHSYEAVAEMAHMIISDEALRQRVVEKQRERLNDLGPEKAEAALRAALDRLGV